jgi:multiple sugar transport system ATP-binding protein
LSLGDQQRVALARALVRRPAAFLMDEPLGALDADMRERMRAEIKRLHLELQATSVYVTHDQIEAMAMGDRVVVMSDAQVQQVGTPAQVYHHPVNLFVARFIGSPGMNLLHGRCLGTIIDVAGLGSLPVPPVWQETLGHQIGNEGDVILGFRPEAARLTEAGTLAAAVYASDMQGGSAMLHLSYGSEAIVHVRAGREVRHPIGSQVRFDLQPDMIRFFDPRTETALSTANETHPSPEVRE